MWEVAQQLPGFGVDLFGEQAKVVGVRGHPIEYRAGAVHLAGPREAFGEPARADDEGSVLRSAPSMQQRVDAQFALDGVHCLPRPASPSTSLTSRCGAP